MSMWMLQSTTYNLATHSLIYMWKYSVTSSARVSVHCGEADLHSTQPMGCCDGFNWYSWHASFCWEVQSAYIIWVWMIVIMRMLWDNSVHYLITYGWLHSGHENMAHQPYISVTSPIWTWVMKAHIRTDVQISYNLSIFVLLYVCQRIFYSMKKHYWETINYFPSEFSN